MSRASFLLASALSLVALAVLVGLGLWQLDRLAWKEALLEMVQARTSQPPELLQKGSWEELTPAADEYRPVQVSGSFDHSRETLLYTVLSEGKGPLRGPGFWVVTPLMLPDGSAILVNRGFVPQDNKDSATRKAGQVEGPVMVHGLLRFAEDPSWFVPDNQPARNAWFRRVPAEIAAARGLADAAPFMIDADGSPNPGGLPLGGQTRVEFPNRHLEYALTWFGLAATLLGVYVAFLVTWLRRRSS
ncbi:SURF1 family protein [Aquabacter sp. L1I39]|uniref:SURF1 family protein n=1 Tax=Aquabacter sp. L1I39 TaxID=2820278 RepID=UPI001ADD2EA2|nr:SURF1 family protein [Aquabacter sp. L1I39]QTL01767.1 SURF1 family protein [Aquabacter sp. L1I39]